MITIQQKTHWSRFIKTKNTTITQQIKFTEILEEDDGAKMFFNAEKQQKAILNFSLDSLIVTGLYKWNIKKRIFCMKQLIINS